jgi:ABC-type multidrug transport system fused ATPase/permease subunit
MFETTRKAFALLSSREKRQIKWLFLATVVMALVEAAGIASVMPFMAVVANPEIMQTNRGLNGLYTILGQPDPRSFQLVLGILVLVALALANAFSAFTTWLLMRFAFLSGHSLSERLLARYLSQPYAFFLNRNTAELGKNVLAEAHRFVTGVLLPAIRMFSKGIVAVTILLLLLLADPMLALIVSTVLGGAYLTIYGLSRKRLGRIGRDSVTLSAARFRSANEALGGVKDLKLLGRESTLLARYAEVSHRFAMVEASSEVVSMLPRYALETLAFGGIIIIVLSLLGMHHSVATILPLVALYALAGYRLMPALQQVYLGMSKLRYNAAVIDVLYCDLLESGRAAAAINGTPGSVDLREKIQLRDLSFSYPGNSTAVLNKVNLAIPANRTIGIVGTTGSGKTTLIDIILGLLTPTQGDMYVDEIQIDAGNVRNWQRNIGYVPQVIYLSDDTIAHNIAFGIPGDEIDREAVARAARVANLHDFVVNDLPTGYDTVVGERGVRLSGGQRQRIGIARALYHDPNVLVLDEATSALDGTTESAIMEAIHRLTHKKTIVLVAHRLTTVRECDVVYLLEGGRIVDQGPFDRLLVANELFRSMANRG